MILIYFYHIENELCAQNLSKYIIFIPQFTTNELRKSNDKTFQKYYVFQEGLSLIIQIFMCMCTCTHTQYKLCTNPLLFTILQVQVKGQVDDTCSGLYFNIFPNHSVGPHDFEDATDLVQAQFQTYLVYVFPSISFTASFQSFVRRPCLANYL